MDSYPKAARRMHQIATQGVELTTIHPPFPSWFAELMHFMADTAHEAGMEIVSCGEELDLSSYGIRPGKCVDDEYIRRVFGIEVVSKKDPSQREACGCVVSKDIGMYDSCLYGCQYCYATHSFDLARRHHKEHNPESPSLIGWHEPHQISQSSESKPKKKANPLNLFDKEALTQVSGFSKVRLTNSPICVILRRRQNPIHPRICDHRCSSVVG